MIAYKKVISNFYSSNDNLWRVQKEFSSTILYPTLLWCSFFFKLYKKYQYNWKKLPISVKLFCTRRFTRRFPKWSKEYECFRKYILCYISSRKHRTTQKINDRFTSIKSDNNYQSKRFHHRLLFGFVLYNRNIRYFEQWNVFFLF